MNNYNCLDLDKVKTLVANYAVIEDSKKYILDEEIVFNPLVIKRKILETNELLSLVKKDFIISFDGIENINNLFEKSNKGIILQPFECAKVLSFHNHCERIKKLFTRIDKELNIRDYTESLYIDKNLFSEITKVIDTNGNIREDASPKLKEIIKNIEHNDKQLNDLAHNFINKHSDSLQEQAIYLRNNRITFLIKNSDKNKYKGYSYGSSSSGLAAYVEPEFIVNLNNKKIELEDERDTEIERILQRLTYIISISADNYINNFDLLMNLDVVYAKTLYGFNNIGIVGDISDDLFLKDICHPLIDKESVISNTYSLKEPYKGIVISGTNTGGKTVGLKLIGLAVILTYLGIPVIASEAHVPMYDSIFVDIDDNQSISNSLSTFSAHISNINNILKNASNKSLILIDELISGTDPKEAQAISLAILNKIEDIGSNFVVTTHYDDVKNYSYNNENILLSSVGFDNNLLKPTYRYIENSIGSSNAMDVASRYFDDINIINKAKEFLNKTNTKENELIEKLAKEINDNLLEKEKVDILLKQNETLNIELNNKLLEINNNKENIRKEYEEKLKEDFEILKEKYIVKLKKADSTKQIEKIHLEEVPIIDKTEKVKFSVGDNVKVGDGDRIGVISNINKELCEVNINGITVKTKLNNLTMMPKTVAKKITVKRSEVKSYKREINLVGYHIDEAINELELFINNATSARLETIKIIHGNGTGQLRKAIRDYLKKHHNVKEFADGDFYDGGSAITMVKLK